MGKEQVIKQAIAELRKRGIPPTPENAAHIIRVKNLRFDGSRDELNTLFYRVLNAPAREQKGEA